MFEWVIQLDRDRRGHYFHKLKSDVNGKTVYVSESYHSKQGAMKTIKRLLKSLKQSRLEDIAWKKSWKSKKTTKQG